MILSLDICEAPTGCKQNNHIDDNEVSMDEHTFVIHQQIEGFGLHIGGQRLIVR